MWGGFLKLQKKCTDKRDLCLKYVTKKKRDRGALLLHLTPANRLHAVHSFPPRRAHSRRRPSPIRFFSGKYRHKSLYAHFPRIFSTPTQINSITESRRQTASAVVCWIAPLCHSVDLYGRDYTGCFGGVQKTGICVWNICMQKAQCCQSRRRL